MKTQNIVSGGPASLNGIELSMIRVKSQPLTLTGFISDFVVKTVPGPFGKNMLLGSFIK